MPEIIEKGKGALTHKIGPLPLWGWAAAGVVAVFIGLKLRGGRSSGGGAGPGLVTIPSIGSGGSPVGGSPPIVNPAQNVIGGMDTAPGGTPPWWVSPPKWWNATQSVPLSGQPSTNGSAGTAERAGIPAWFTRVPTGPSNIIGMPSGAAVTTIGGTNFSLSDEALKRNPIPGASAPRTFAWLPGFDQTRRGDPTYDPRQDG